MRYQITKIRNGLWEVRFENGKVTQHSTRYEAEKYVMTLQGPSEGDNKGNIMNIYEISQNKNGSYDTYSASIVYAPDEETARNIHPDGKENKAKGDEEMDEPYGSWTGVRNVSVRLVGTAPDDGDEYHKGVILSSYHAG